MTRITAYVILVLLCCMIAGCSEKAAVTSEPGGNVQPELNPLNLSTTELSIADNTNEFAFKFFKAMCANTPSDSNLFMSPMSASYALMLAANGVADEMRDSMLHVLEFHDLSLDQINEGYHHLTEVLMNADPDVTFALANSIWASSDYPFNPDYVSVVNQYYDARVESLDFTQPWVADTINQWVKDNTNNKIESMVQHPLDFYAILLNAIYLNASWRLQFDTALTTVTPFTLADGSTKDWEMMVQYDVVDPADSTQPHPDILFYMGDDFALGSLPYGSEGFAMAVIVPDEEHTVGDLIDEMNWPTFRSWLGQAQPGFGVISIPKFKFACEMDMTHELIALGMGPAFSTGLPNMFANTRGAIDQVRQKAFVRVDEEGTEAAAVTAVTLRIEDEGEMIGVNANRPHLFIIYEKSSGAIMFMAKIAEPVWEG